MAYFNFFLPAFAAFLFSVLLVPIIKKYALKKNLAVSPLRERDVHKGKIPRLGGLAIFFSFLLVVLGYLIFQPQALRFVQEKFLGIDKNLFGVLLGGLILVAVNVYDDIKGLKPWPKFFWQTVAAAVVVLFGIRIWWLSNPFGGNIIVLGTLSGVFVMVWIILLTNVVNWLDGLDGLASGVSLISLVVLFLLSLASEVNQPATALLAAIMIGAVLGFLPFNFYPAKIFLGDSGSMFLGFMLAIISIISGGKVATAALVLGVPILDAIFVILRRLIKKQPLMRADRYHLHHEFLRAGFSQRQTVIFYYFLSVIFGIIALLNSTQGKFIASFYLLGLMLVLIAVLFLIKKLKIKP